jgi:benzoyl-CoA 2,3-epoxidase subunit B
MSTTFDYNERIPNNVNLSDDRRLQRALEQWQPQFLDWWRQLGPVEYQDADVFLRTAVSVQRDGWAHFDYVKMPAITRANRHGKRCQASTDPISAA